MALCVGFYPAVDMDGGPGGEVSGEAAGRIEVGRSGSLQGALEAADGNLRIGIVRSAFARMPRRIFGDGAVRIACESFLPPEKSSKTGVRCPDSVR